MTPEGKVKEAVKKLLKAYAAYWHSPVQNGMGRPSLDMICCVNGMYVAIETKRPGGKLTPRQKLTIAEILAAGGKVFVIGEHVAPLPYEYSGMKELEDFLILAQKIMVAYGDASTGK